MKCRINNVVKHDLVNPVLNPDFKHVYVILMLQLVLNPVQDVIPLRPSMEYLDSGGSKKRNDPNVIVEEGSSNDVRSGQSSEQVLLLN
jgi:hypothetical protein